MTEPNVKKPKSRKFLLALGAIATTIATIAHLLVGAPLPSKEALAPAPVLVVEEAPADPVAGAEEVAQ